MLQKEILNYIFSKYDEYGIEYCLLRNYENLPENLGSNDVDILITQKHKKKNKNVVYELIKKFDLVIYNNYEDERIFQFFFYKKDVEGRPFFLKIDYFFQSEIYGCRYIDERQFILNRKRYKNFYIADPVDGLLDKIIYLYLLNAKIPERYITKVQEIIETRADELYERINLILGERLGSFLFHSLKGGQQVCRKVTLRQRLLVLACLAIKAPSHHLVKLPVYLYYRFKYRLFPEGDLISLSGPDGCGKTTLIDILSVYLTEAFRFGPENIVHHRPHLLPRIAELAKKTKVIKEVDEDYSKPHRGKTSGLVGSIIRLGYYVSDYLIGYFSKIRPTLVRREPMLFDRYYYDVIADCERSNISLSHRLLEAGFAMVPTPGIAFYINVSIQTVLERKQELTPESLRRITKRYKKLLVTREEFWSIDNEHEARYAANEMIDKIIMKRAVKIKQV